ncbi:MAG TPA: YncE family protein [Rhizomicrobium sp.]|nr:YncE family protein [Rhizomicrobium sp.]
MRATGLGLALVIGFSGVAASAQTAPAYHVTKTVALGAPDRWDYLVYDAPSHRLYVSHGDRVTVLDGQDGKVLGNVEGMPGGSHGIGIVSAVGKGYTDDGKAGEAVAFDLKTLKTGKRIKAEDDADGIAFDPTSGHIFVVDGDSKVLTVIDPKTDTAIASINAGGGLEYAVSGNNGKLYVDGAEKKEIVRIDTATNKVDAHWPIPDCTSPHGLAIDTKAQRLFASCVNSVLTVVNAQSGAVVATLPIGKGTDGAAFDPVRKLIFSSNFDGTVSVIREVSPEKYQALDSIKTQVTGKNMTIDPASGRLYVAAADIDPNAPVAMGANGRPGRPKPLPGSLKILFLDPDR